MGELRSSAATAEELAGMIRRFRRHSTEKSIEAMETIALDPSMPSGERRQRRALLSEIREITWKRFVYAVREQYPERVVSDALAIVKVLDATEGTSESRH